MERTTVQWEQLYNDGYVTLPGIIPLTKVEQALHAINRSLGEEGIDPARLPQFRAQSYCPELQRAPEIVGLFNDTALHTVAEEAIGAGQFLPVKGAQIALRFPTTPGPEGPRQPTPHLDGMPTSTNGLSEGDIHSFTALIGVFLTDLPRPFMGNFTVWPGSHHQYEAYFRQHTPQLLLKGMPPVELAAPQQFIGKAGDAVFCHYQLGHGIATNISPFIRYAVFFRLTHINHQHTKWETMTDIWQEWAGLQTIAAGKR
jgi:hypothetical protein